MANDLRALAAQSFGGRSQGSMVRQAGKKKDGIGDIIGLASSLVGGIGGIVGGLVSKGKGGQKKAPTKDATYNQLAARKALRAQRRDDLFNISEDDEDGTSLVDQLMKGE